MDQLSTPGAGREDDATVARLRDAIRREPQKTSLVQDLADALVAAGRPLEAAEALGQLADSFARAGSPGKAIALLKKIQRLDPEHMKKVEESIALLSKERDQQLWMQSATHRRRMPSGSVAPIALELDDDLAFGHGDERHRTEASDVEALAFELDTDEPSLQKGSTEPAERPEIGTSPLFSDFSTDELLAVMREMRLVTKEPGDLVVLEGEVGDSLFVLTTGTVKAFVKDKDGRGQMVRQMTDGAFFGEVAILSGKPRTATITAATDCELLELDRRSLDAITQTHPRVLQVLETFSAMRLNSAAEAQGRQARKRADG